MYIIFGFVGLGRRKRKGMNRILGGRVYHLGCCRGIPTCSLEGPDMRAPNNQGADTTAGEKVALLRNDI